MSEIDGTNVAHKFHMSIVPAIVLLFAIVHREFMECIEQGPVTGATPYCAIVTSSSNGSLLDASKIKSALIELKFGTVLFSSTPDTMVVLFFRNCDVTPCHAHLRTCGMKNQSFVSFDPILCS